MKQLKLVLTVSILVSSTQAFGLSETAQHKAKAAGWGAMLAANAAIVARSLHIIVNHLTGKQKSNFPEVLVTNTYLRLVTLGFISTFAYDKFKQEYALAFPKKDLKDEKA